MSYMSAIDAMYTEMLEFFQANPTSLNTLLSYEGDLDEFFRLDGNYHLFEDDLVKRYEPTGHMISGALRRVRGKVRKG